MKKIEKLLQINVSQKILIEINRSWKICNLTLLKKAYEII